MSSQKTVSTFRAGCFQLDLGKRTWVMGILNITPDSFSDGGRYAEPSLAIARAREMVEQGADLIDIGGESTRPGSAVIPTSVEINRIVPIVAQLAQTLNVPLSVDTFKSEVAEAALSAGATIINDVTGLLGDPRMAEVAARHRAGLVLMHNAVLYRRGQPVADVFTNLPELPDSIRSELTALDLLAAVRHFLFLGCQRAMDAGIEPDQLMLDPGIGFGLLSEESLELIDRLGEIQCLPGLRLPVLAGPSRKRFIGELLGRPPEDRAIGTAAAVSASIARGADVVRVHDVEVVAQTTRICDAILRRTGTNS
jgi:dihydropteroate synthase